LRRQIFIAPNGIGAVFDTNGVFQYFGRFPLLMTIHVGEASPPHREKMVAEFHVAHDGVMDIPAEIYDDDGKLMIAVRRGRGVASQGCGVPELARNPTVKEERAASGLPVASGLLFTYPVHQAADILFCHGNVVPVGNDQLPHLEMTRVIARRFNQRYSPDEPFFPNPRRCSQAPRACSGPTARR